MNRLNFAPQPIARWTLVLCVLFALTIGQLASVHRAAAATELELWTYYGDTGPAADCMNKSTADFAKAQDKYTVKIRNIPFSSFNQELTTGIASNTTPDIIIVDNPDSARYASIGALADLTGKVKEWGQADKYLAGPWNSNVWDGKNYGVPLGSNTIVLWINADMAKAAGLDVTKAPKTWEDLTTWAEKLTNKDKGVYGITLLGKHDETSTFEFLPWLLQNGADLTTLDSPEAVAALQLWWNLIDKGYAPKDTINNGFAEIYQQFTTGKAAMMFSGTWNLSTLPTDAKFKWVAVPLPYSKKPASSLGGENFAVMAASKNIDGAWEYIKFMQDPAYAPAFYSCMNYLPSRSDVAAELTKNADDTMKAFLTQMESAQPRGPLPNWSDASGVIQDALQEALSGQKTPEQALKDAAVKIKPILEASGTSMAATAAK
ncbi:MAG: sugar ABC transporter substrate-binding protein [Chloroflexota bacterium]